MARMEEVALRKDSVQMSYAAGNVVESKMFVVMRKENRLE